MLRPLYSVLSSLYSVQMPLYSVLPSFGYFFIIFGAYFIIFGGFFDMIVTSLCTGPYNFELVWGKTQNAVTLPAFSSPKMEAILKELHLEGLGAQLRRERIVPSTILAMTDEQIERLGVSAIGDRVRLRLLCRDFEEGSAGTSAGGGSVAGARPSADAIREERERLFNPRGSRTQSKNKKKQSARTWTVQFVCLADRYQCKIPSATEKQTLHKAGLGVKRIKLQLDDDETSVHGKLISGEKDDAGDMKGFPQLREAGGFEMLHCLPNCRDLTPLKCSWAVRELRCNLGGQSKIYLRPIQRNLSTKSLLPENCCEVKEKCISCKKEFPMSELRTHSFYMCSAGFDSDSHSDSEGEKIKESHTLDSKVDAILVDDSLQLESSQAEEEQDSPAVSSQAIAKHDQDPVDTVISYCEANNIQNPVEILRCMQKNIVTGRALELESDSETLEGKTNYINVDRMNLLETTFEEVGALEDLRLTLEVSFYGEVGLFCEQFLFTYTYSLLLFVPHVKSITV